MVYYVLTNVSPQDENLKRRLIDFSWDFRIRLATYRGRPVIDFSGNLSKLSMTILAMKLQTDVVPLAKIPRSGVSDDLGLRSGKSRITAGSAVIFLLCKLVCLGWHCRSPLSSPLRRPAGFGQRARPAYKAVHARCFFLRPPPASKTGRM